MAHEGAGRKETPRTIKGIPSFQCQATLGEPRSIATPRMTGFPGNGGSRKSCRGTAAICETFFPVRGRQRGGTSGRFRSFLTVAGRQCLGRRQRPPVVSRSCSGLSLLNLWPLALGSSFAVERVNVCPTRPLQHRTHPIVLSGPRRPDQVRCHSAHRRRIFPMSLQRVASRSPSVFIVMSRTRRS